MLLAFTKTAILIIQIYIFLTYFHLTLEASTVTPEFTELKEVDF